MWIHSEMRMWHDKNIQLTLQALTMQTYDLVPFTRWRCDLRKGVIVKKLKKVFFRKD